MTLNLASKSVLALFITCASAAGYFLDKKIDVPLLTSGSFVHALAVDHQGRIFVAGDFTVVNGHPAQNLVRLLPTGAVDPSFNVYSVFERQRLQSIHPLRS